jgi:hypothetical protein
MNLWRKDYGSTVNGILSYAIIFRMSHTKIEQPIKMPVKPGSKLLCLELTYPDFFYEEQARY